MESLFIKYNNIKIFATDTKYRGYLSKDKFLEFEEFTKQMTQKGYVVNKFINKFNQSVDIILFSANSKYISATANFKKLLDTYKKNAQQQIIMITKADLNVYRKKTIRLYKYLTIFNYLHRNFIIEVNKGPLCSKHTILSSEQTHDVCIQLMTHGHRLPAIFEDDIQNIWIGGEINQVIKVESISEITGHSIRYRIVTPSSGKVSQTSTSITEDIIDEETKQKNEQPAQDEEKEEYYEEYYEEDVSEEAEEPEAVEEEV